MNPLLLRWLVVATVAVASGGFCWVKGAAHAQTKWDLAEARRTAAAEAELATAYAKVRARDAQAATDMADLGRRYQEEIQREKTDRDRLVARLRAGDVRLQLPAGSTAGGLRVPETAGAGSFCHGEAGAQLPASLAGDLAALASDADDVARQLSACQAALTLTRKTCDVQAQ